MVSESVENLCLKARQAVAQGNHEEARQLYLQALGLKSDSPDVHYGLATVCFLLSDLPSAAYHFKEVTRLDPLRAGAHINLGAVYNRLDQVDEAIQVLRASKIGRDRTLQYHNVPLTSEKLRAVIETAILQASGTAAHTIVAGGRQGCDPHEKGHGTLKANEPIIIDIYPRSQRTGYFGDITRTVVRGRASEELRRVYDTVLQAQKLAFKKMHAGTRTNEVHKAVMQLFENQGFDTRRRNGRMEGFFHGTGHGVGLEIHEAPRVSKNSIGNLKPGHVVTVEPGLYYAEIGGVRLEDVALVTRNGARNLTHFEKVLEI